MRESRRWQYAIAIAALCMAAAVQATDSREDPGPVCPASGVRELEQARIDVTGMNRVTRTVSLPADAAVLIAVTERGIDVRIEATLAAGQVQTADSPIRRWGPQRIMIEPGPARRIELAVIGKERVSGTAVVRTYLLPAAEKADDCLAASRWLASGDAHYDRGQAVTLGRVSAEPGTARKEYFAAVADYSAAVRRLSPAPRSLALAQAELSIAATYYQGLDDWKRTIEHSAPASAAFAQLDNGYGHDRAQAMTAAGEMEDLLSQPRSRTIDLAAEERTRARQDRVRSEWFRLAKSFAARGKHFDEALALNSAGLVYSNERDFEHAIDTFHRALDLYDPAEQTRRAQTLQNIGLAQLELARMAEARDSFLRALRSLDENEYPRLYADTTNNLALCEFRMGRVDEALAHYSRAIEVFSRIQVPREAARSLNGIGAVYYSVGRRTEAAMYLNRALILRTPQLDPVGRGATLRALADVERDRGRFGNAVKLREEASTLTNIAAFQTRLKIELAHDLMKSGKLAEAAAQLDAVFATGFPRDAVARARALRERARLSYAQGAFGDSEKDARESVIIFRGLGLSASAFGALLQQADAACALHNSAVNQLAKEALAQSEQLRDASDNPALRASAWQGLRPAFDLAIRVAAAPSLCGGSGSGDGVAALVVAENSRGRALAEFRHLAATASAEPSAAEKRRRELFSQIAARRARLELLADRTEKNERQLQTLRSEIEDLKFEIDILGAKLGGTSGNVRVTRESLRRSSETLRPDTAVVEYWLGESKSFAWLVTKGTIQMVDLGDTARIDAAARNLYGAMHDFERVPLAERLQNARALSELIIAPLPAEFRRARRIYFVADGSLHTVPFAALSIDEAGNSRFLVNDHDIAVAASVSAVADDGSSVRLNAGAQVLIVADPVYSREDARLPGAITIQPQAAAQPRRHIQILRGDTVEDSGWTRLIASGREAAAITKVLPGAAIELLTGFAANRDAVLGRDLRGFRVLHFATHAVADLETPALSTIVLSTLDERGATRAGAVFAGDILYRPLDADLVVFSGCDTALGQSTAGEGLFGLRYAAHAAGARTVVASLWPVVDRVGEALMTEFYAAMTRDRLPPAAALSQSMRRASERWPDPAFWSVFEVSRVARAANLH